jgi:hypothetical protein
VELVRTGASEESVASIFISNSPRIFILKMGRLFLRKVVLEDRHGEVSQKTAIYIVTTVITSSPTKIILFGTVWEYGGTSVSEAVPMASPATETCPPSREHPAPGCNLLGCCSAL